MERFCDDEGDEAKAMKAMNSCESAGDLPVLPFLDFSVLPRKNLKFTKDFRSLPNAQNPWKRQRKYQFNQGNSLLKINQGNPKKPRKGRTGLFSRNFRAIASDVARMWLGCGLNKARMWLRRSSDLFSGVVQTVWQKLRERGFQHSGTEKVFQ